MSIVFHEDSKTFYLEGKNITYAFFINRLGFPEHLWFGDRVGRDDLTYARATGGTCSEVIIPGTESKQKEYYNRYLAEYPTYGIGDYHECAIQLLYPNGSRINNFVYESHEILSVKPDIPGMPSMRGGETLVLTLKDKYSEVYVRLYYTVYEDSAVVARHSEIVNRTRTPLYITRAYSFNLDLHGNNYEMLSFYGAWATERCPERIPLHHGVVSIDSKRGASSATLNPFMAIVTPDTTEDSGKAYGINLVYSSSYVLKAECDPKGDTRLLGGINDFDFRWLLDAGESFSTPEAVICYSPNGLGGMSREYHDAYRTHLINPRYAHARRPIVINNWEATYFDFDNERLMSIIDAVKGTGIDTFVLDDGWFGNRNNDRAGLGDWVINTKKLSGGLKPVIDHAHKAGMKFGLWFEPEMVNPDSDLYRAHPDWAIHVPGITPSPSRNQLVLDITRKDVREYIVDSVSAVLSENEIDYVKWDFNRTLTENFSVQLPAERQQEMHHRYALGLYDLCERLVNGFPQVFFEGCASGGARFDPAMLFYFPQIWTSDDTDANMRAEIQYGTSFCYPLSTMSCHTSICPNHQTHRTVPFSSRADIAHLGATGYELDTTKITEEELREIPEQIRAYHEMEDLVLEGDLYRLEDPTVSNYFGFEIVSKDKRKAHITVMRSVFRPNDEVKRIYPKGLDDQTKYTVSELNITLSGSTLMALGLVVPSKARDFNTFVFNIIAK